MDSRTNKSKVYQLVVHAFNLSGIEKDVQFYSMFGDETKKKHTEKILPLSMTFVDVNRK